MLIEKIDYKDYNGNPRTATLHFNLSKAECMELEMIYGGLQEYLQKLVDEHENEKLVMFFKNFILKGYGEKSEDGKYFRKSKERSEDFASTEAYSELFMKLISDQNYMKNFFVNMLPEDYRPGENDEIPVLMPAE
jgi:hypothetical protein